MKYIRLFLFFILVISMSSCATIFTGSKQTVQVNSNPPGAQIEVNGISRGVTPSPVVLKKGKEGETITLKLDGYEDKTFRPTTVFNAVAIINLSNLIGWGIDIGTGAIWKYDQSYYNIQLKNKDRFNGNGSNPPERKKHSIGSPN
jgi:hypothetical protein